MTKREFIAELEEALNGAVSTAVKRENINYYEGYIREQIANGRSELEVMELLGDPRLIAKTIIETNGGDGSYETESNYKKTEESNYSNSYNQSQPKKWYNKVLIIGGIALAIFIVFSLLMGIISLVTWIAGPLLILLLFYFILSNIFKIFKR